MFYHCVQCCTISKEDHQSLWLFLTCTLWQMKRALCIAGSLNTSGGSAFFSIYKYKYKCKCKYKYRWRGRCAIAGPLNSVNTSGASGFFSSYSYISDKARKWNERQGKVGILGWDYMSGPPNPSSPAREGRINSGWFSDTYVDKLRAILCTRLILLLSFHSQISLQWLQSRLYFTAFHQNALAATLENCFLELTKVFISFTAVPSPVD